MKISTTSQLKTIITPLLIIILVSSCRIEQAELTTTTTTKSRAFPSVFKELLDHNGGYDQWQEYQTLEYYLTKDGVSEKHFVDLRDRHVRIDHEDYSLVSKAGAIEIIPDYQSFPLSSPKLYSNLYSYFYTIPFVLADPGIQYETIGDYSLHGSIYHAIRHTFGTQSDKDGADFFISLIDKQTSQLSHIIYSTSDFAEGIIAAKGLLTFSNWEQVGSLKLPSSIVASHFANNVIGDTQFSLKFEQADLMKAPLPSEIFEL